MSTASADTGSPDVGIMATCPRVEGWQPTVEGTVIRARAYWQCYGTPGDTAEIFVRLQQNTFWGWRTVQEGNHWRNTGNIDEIFFGGPHFCAGGGQQEYRTWTFGRVGEDPSKHAYSDSIHVNCG